MNKIILTAALGLMLGATAASAQTSVYAAATPSPLRLQLAQLHRDHAFGIGTNSAFTRNVGPGSSVTPGQNAYGNGNSGDAPVAGAPSATAVNGGSH